MLLALINAYKSDYIDLINEYGPEHLVLQVENAEELSLKIENAGSVFIENYTPVAAGDYASGTIPYLQMAF